MWTEETNLIRTLPTLSLNVRILDVDRATVTFTRDSPKKTLFHVVPNSDAPRFKNNRFLKEFVGDVFLESGHVRTANFLPKRPEKYVELALYEWVDFIEAQIVPLALEFNSDPRYIDACKAWELATEQILDTAVRDLRRQHQRISDILGRYRPTGISRFGGELTSQMDADTRSVNFAEGKISGIMQAITAIGGVYVDAEAVARRLILEEFKKEEQ